MDATFTVDAYTGETFRGKIRQVRLAATTVQNVVTYNAVIDVSNPDLRLKPGMTANVKVLIEKVENALRLPNAALRFQPELSDAAMADSFKRAGEERFYNFYRNQGNRAQTGVRTSMQAGSGERAAMGAAGANRSGGSESNRYGQSRSGGGNRSRRAPVWIIGQDKLIRPVVLKLGLTDGIETEIVEGKLKEGDKIILSAEVGNHTASPAANRAPGFGTPMGGRMMR
jgi:HlyD family secretion protein